MLRILLLFLIIIAAIIFGPTLAGYQGKIVIELAGYSIQMSVTGLAIMLVIALTILGAIIWFLRRLLKMSVATKNWFFDSKEARSERMTQAAMLKLIEGDYERAEKLLVNSAKYATQPMVNYLLAAESAQRRNDLVNTNLYLENATAVAGKDIAPVDIAKVRIQLANGAYDTARNGVDKLLNNYPRHPEVLRLASKAYIATAAYSTLLDLLPALKKMAVYSDDELEHLQQQTYIGLMQEQLSKEGSEGLKRWWDGLARKIRQNGKLQVAVASKFIEGQDHLSAEQIITDGLKQDYNEGLIALMPKLHSTHLDVLEQMLWKLIKKHGSTPLLNSTLAQLLIQHGDWQTASEQLRLALEQHPNPQDYALLADSYEHLSQQDDANKVRREALELTLKPQ